MKIIYRLIYIFMHVLLIPICIILSMLAILNLLIVAPATYLLTHRLPNIDFFYGFVERYTYFLSLFKRRYL